MIQRSVLVILFFVLTTSGRAQPEIQVNGNIELELSRAGDRSHFYYNGVHVDHTDWRLGPSEANVLAVLKFNEQWSVNTRLILRRDLGASFDKFQLGQANLQWAAKEKPLRIAIGRFLSPFGTFNNKQFPMDRTFIDLPLAYGYYLDLSDRAGWMDSSSWGVPGIGGKPDWGVSTHYWGGYTDGVKLSWDLVADKTLLELAIVNGASLTYPRFSDPLRWGVIGRLAFQPNYFWEQGFSLSHGTYLQANPVNETLVSLNDFRQTLLGTDFKFGIGYFELSGEAMFSFFNVPRALKNGNAIVGVTGEESIHLFTGYVELRVRTPVFTRYLFGLPPGRHAVSRTG